MIRPLYSRNKGQIGNDYPDSIIKNPPISHHKSSHHVEKGKTRQFYMTEPEAKSLRRIMVVNEVFDPRLLRLV